MKISLSTSAAPLPLSRDPGETTLQGDQLPRLARNPGETRERVGFDLNDEGPLSRPALGPVTAVFVYIHSQALRGAHTGARETGHCRSINPDAERAVLLSGASLSRLGQLYRVSEQFSKWGEQRRPSPTRAGFNLSLQLELERHPAGEPSDSDLHPFPRVTRNDSAVMKTLNFTSGGLGWTLSC